MTLSPDNQKTAAALAPARKAHQAGDLEKARNLLEDSPAREYRSHPAFKALYGAVLIQAQQPDKGRPLVQQAVREAENARPALSSWAADLGLGLFLLGEPEKASRFLKLAVSLPGPDSAAYTRLGAVLMTFDSLEPAEEAFRRAVSLDPDRSEAHCNLGYVCARLGKLDDALIHYDRALLLKPDFPVAAAHRASLLVALERADEAVLDLEERLENEPESIALHCHLAHVLNAAGRFDEARGRLKKAAEIDPGNVDVLLQLAQLLFERSRYRAVIKILNQALETDPENIHALSLLARAYSEMNRLEKADETVETLLRFHSEAPAALLTRAIVRSARDDFEGADKDLDRVLDAMPGLYEAWGLKGHNLMLTGRMDEAIACFRRASEMNPSALADLVQARSYPDDPQIIERMVKFSENPLLAKQARASMNFALAKLFEKQDDYESAFEQANKANKLIRPTLSYDCEWFDNRVEKMIQAFTPELFSRFRGLGSPSTRPVFVVGMPRSGTTLTEQMLCSHPAVYGAGELGFINSITLLMPRVIGTKTPYPECVPQLKDWMPAHAASYYLKKIADLDEHSLKVVDKLPHNFMNLGLIALIFPRAAIIHVRRDPRDVAVSNYFTNFKHKHGGMGYAYDLKDLGRMLKAYQRIMDHWRSVLPGGVFEVAYEDLVENPWENIEKMLRYAGLKWDDRVMEFYKTERPVKTASVWQVRQPLYTSSRKRWKRYEKFLAPLDDILNNDTNS